MSPGQSEIQAPWAFAIGDAAVVPSISQTSRQPRTKLLAPPAPETAAGRDAVPRPRAWPWSAAQACRYVSGLFLPLPVLRLLIEETFCPL